MKKIINIPLQILTWPSKIFDIDEKRSNFDELYGEIKAGVLPNALGVIDNRLIEKKLLTHNFIKKSVVKGMFLNLSHENKSTDNFPAIQKVDTVQKAVEFSKVASKSFGYEILPNTIIALLNCESKVRLYIGKHKGIMVGCGIVFLDHKNISGIHMIGTIDKYRGLGLGKKMTIKLIHEAFINGSNKVVLVASEAGERIYSKLGFITEGGLVSYSITL